MIVTAPTVHYKIDYTNGTSKIIENPNDFPTDKNRVKNFLEPSKYYHLNEVVTATIIFPVEYLNIITQLLMERRGEQISIENLGKDRIILVYILPMV